jgi:tetratricopeptide (TPR) repeat protein
MVASAPPASKPYLDFATFYARVGQPGLAREFLAGWDSVSDENRKHRERAERRGVEGIVALAEGRAEAAIAHLRFAHERTPYSTIAYLIELGMAYQRAEEPDSALVQYERYLNTPYINRFLSDALWLPFVYKRLAELYEERGDREQAIHYYNDFVELWLDADPELQPQVEDVLRRIARLVAEPRG